MIPDFNWKPSPFPRLKDDKHPGYLDPETIKRGEYVVGYWGGLPTTIVERIEANKALATYMAAYDNYRKAEDDVRAGMPGAARADRGRS